MASDLTLKVQLWLHCLGNFCSVPSFVFYTNPVVEINYQTKLAVDKVKPSTGYGVGVVMQNKPSLC